MWWRTFFRQAEVAKLALADAKSDLWKVEPCRDTIIIHGTGVDYQDKVLSAASHPLQILEFTTKTYVIKRSELKLSFWFESTTLASVPSPSVTIDVFANDHHVVSGAFPALPVKQLHEVTCDITRQAQADEELWLRVNIHLPTDVKIKIPLSDDHSPRVQQRWHPATTIAVMVFWIAVWGGIQMLVLFGVTLAPWEQLTKDWAAVGTMVVTVVAMLGTMFTEWAKAPLKGFLRWLYPERTWGTPAAIGVSGLGFIVLFAFFIIWEAPVIRATRARMTYRGLIEAHLTSPKHDRDAVKLRKAFALIPERIEAQSLLARHLALLPQGRERRRFVDELKNDTAIQRSIQSRREGAAGSHFLEDQALGEDPVIWYGLLLPAQDQNDDWQIGGRLEALRYLQGYRNCPTHNAPIRQVLTELLEIEIADFWHEKLTGDPLPAVFLTVMPGPLGSAPQALVLPGVERALVDRVTALSKSLLRRFRDAVEGSEGAHYYQEAGDRVAQFLWKYGNKGSAAAKETVAVFAAVLDLRERQRALNPLPTLRAPQKLMLYAIVQASAQRRGGTFDYAAEEFLANGAFRTAFEEHIGKAPRYEKYRHENEWFDGTLLSPVWIENTRSISKQLELGWKY